jgi:mono/diheme cytochrome c family protein
MSKITTAIFLLIFLVVVSSLLSFRYSATIVERTPDEHSRAKKNYNTYCVGCHGINLEGFIDHTWKNGNSKPYLIKTITKGYPDGSMPGSEKVLTKTEITELANYILDRIKQGKK